MLRPVHPDDLHGVWEYILPGLKKVMRHSTSHWIPEDVYHAIKSGNSVLHLMDDTGFMVSTAVNHFDGKVLHVWILYNNSKNDAIDENMPQLEMMARALGAKRVTFWSPRKWERRLAKYGFRPSQTEFVKEIV